jgi:lipopolysaccharide export system protein LptA
LNKAEIGGLGGAGIGALLGQVIGGNTVGTLIGAGVGAGLGYIIGNEVDKKEVQKRNTAMEQETWPLAGTTWTVVSVTPRPEEPIKSKTSQFNPDGTLTTTTTYWNGRTVTDSGRYRIVGQTLIINQDNYVINATFHIEGDRLCMDTGKRSIVLQRM